MDALQRLVASDGDGFFADPNQTVGDYLTAWLQAKAMALKPTTMARYRAYVQADLVPALGHIKLDDLGYAHIAAFVRNQFAHGRGPVTVHRILATLSSALGEAVKHHRLDRNPARPTIIPRPAAAERHIWTVQETLTSLQYSHTADPLMADLVELLIGTGIRKGGSPRTSLGGRPPRRARPPYTPRALRDRQQPARTDHTQNPRQQELGRHLRPRRHRPPPPRP